VRLLVVLALIASVLLGSVYTGLRPFGRPSDAVHRGTAPNLSAASAAARAASLVNSQHPAPIHGNTWVSRSTARHGFQADSSQEVNSLDTTNAVVFANADGTSTAQVYDTAINYVGSDGLWHRIDPTLVTKSDGTIHNTAGPADFSFASSIASTSLVTVSSGNTSVSEFSPILLVQPSGGAPTALRSRTSTRTGLTQTGTAQVSGNTVTYASVLPNTNLEFITTLHTMKELLILQSAPLGVGDLVFRFALSSKGLTFQTNADGSISLLDASGNTTFVIPPGTMADNNVDPASGNSATSGITYALGPNSQYIDVIASGAWLRDPARVYPVNIDPSVTVYGGTNDAYIADLYPNSNYHQKYDSPQSDYDDWMGCYSGCSAGSSTTSGYTGNNWTLMKFDMPASISNQYISSARWNGYFDWSSSCSPTTYWLWRATTSWSATGVKWSSKPSLSTDSATGSVAANSSACGSERRTWSSADITAWVRGWTSGQYPNNGVVINENGNGSTYWKKVAADETTTGNYPHIDVNYTGYGPVNWRFQSSEIGRAHV